MKKQLFKLYWALERLITPHAESSQNAYARIVKARVTPSTRWLELGCGHQLWPDWIPGEADTARKASVLVGIDPDLESIRQNRVVDHRVVGLTLPFRDASFDLVTANMVFEHLEDPVAVLRDIRRVLTPNGVCIFHTANALYWQTALGGSLPQFVKNALVRFSEGRDAADVYPTHYRINTARAIPRVLEEAGFVADDVIMLNTSATSRILLLGPLVVLELLWIRLTRRPSLSHHRSNIIGIVRPAVATRAARPREERIA